VLELEEMVDISYSYYDDAPENDHESSKEDEDELEDEIQALPSIFHPEVSDCRKETSYSSTNHCQSTGQCSEETNCHGSGGHCFFRRFGGRGTGSTLFHGSIRECTGLRGVGLVRKVLWGSTGFC
jgi:hypothetical protein